MFNTIEIKCLGELLDHFSNAHITLLHITLDSDNDERNLGVNFGQDLFLSTPILGKGQPFPFRGHSKYFTFFRQ